MVGRRGWAQNFGENRLQRVRPHLVTFELRMQLVTVAQHALIEPAIRVRQLVVDVEIADRLPVRHFRQTRH